MKRKLYLPVVALVVIAMGMGVGGAFADEKAEMAMKKGKSVTVEGILIDTKCYGMSPMNWKADHMTPKGEMALCAQTCANMGIPVGVLKDGKEGGDVFILVTPAPVLSDHMAKTVKVTGMSPYKGAIIPDKFFVKNDKGEWEEVKLATMM